MIKGQVKTYLTQLRPHLGLVSWDSSMNCSTLWERAAGSLANNSQASLKLYSRSRIMNNLTKHSAPAPDVMEFFYNSKTRAPARHLLMLWKNWIGKGGTPLRLPHRPWFWLKQGSFRALGGRAFSRPPSWPWGSASGSSSPPFSRPCTPHKKLLSVVEPPFLALAEPCEVPAYSHFASW